MGNSIVYEMDDESGYDIEIENDDSDYSRHAIIDFDAFSSPFRQMIDTIRMIPVRLNSDMPVIRKKPDLKILRHSQLYKEIKLECGLAPNSRLPNDNWSLTRQLMRRECGLNDGRPGCFSPNQQRNIANMFLPNNREEKLMALDSKVFISRFNKDGSRLITAAQNSFIRISDSSKGTYQLLNRMKAKDVNWSILDVDISPCGRFLAYSTWSDYFFVVPIEGSMDDLKWLYLNTTQNRCGIFSLRFSPCGSNLVGGCNNSCLYVVNRETRHVTTIQINRSFQLDVNAVCFVNDQDCNVFASGDNDGLVKLWDMRCLGDTNNSRNCATPVSSFLGHLDGITYIDTRNDGNYILSNSKDQSIKLWDLRKPSPRVKVRKCNNTLPYLEWDYRWDSVPQEYYNPKKTLDGDASIMTYRGHRVTKSLLRAKFSPATQTGQRFIYTGCGTGRIIIYDLLTGCIREAIDGHRDIVRDLDWHPVRPEIISSSWDSHVHLNTFKRDVLQRPKPVYTPSNVRRSKRIAHRNGELDDSD